MVVAMLTRPTAVCAAVPAVAAEKVPRRSVGIATRCGCQAGRGWGRLAVSGAKAIASASTTRIPPKIT